MDDNSLFAREPAAQAPEDLAQILDSTAPQPRVSDEPAASQELSRDQSDATGPGKTDKESSWTFKAFESERKKRQAYSARVKELEEENAALLAERSQEPEVDPAETQRWLDPLGSMNEIAIKQNGRVSRAEYIAEFGRGTFEDLDRAVGAALESGHPDVPILAQRMRSSDDPVGVMEKWAKEVIGWSPEASRPAPRPVMPSNFAGARNVGTRSAPAWTGPPSLNDIFDTNSR